MTILDPDSGTAARFERERIARDIYVRSVVQEELMSAQLEVAARFSYEAADAYMKVKAEQSPIIPEFNK